MFLGSGIGPQTWVGNLELKGGDGSVESKAGEVQCALLTLVSLQPTPPMRDVDRNLEAKYQG